MKKVILKRKKEAALQRFHPWVFSGAIKRIEGKPEDGDIVGVLDAEGNYLATGHFQEGSIMVRVFSFGAEPIDQNFWTQKLTGAYQLRKEIGLTESEATNCYRLVHAEGDGLPGLIIDLYDRTAVIQCHSIGMHRQLSDIQAALLHVPGPKLEAVFDKSKETLPGNYAAGISNRYLYGTSTRKTVLENGCQFLVDWETGQKTGFFLDQRQNRQLVGEYSRGKKVLNAFCYSGGFSVYALKAGALKVDSVDSSAPAIHLTDQNVRLNDLPAQSHQSHTRDVLEFLRQSTTEYDLIIVDPPAYAKKLTKRHNAVQGYKRLNTAAIGRLAPRGILFTFSCSQVVSRTLFENTIVAAVLESGRTARILHHLEQPPDHPVSLFHPEGSYLKGLVLRIE